MCLMCVEWVKALTPIERINAGRELLSTAKAEELDHIMEEIQKAMDEAKEEMK